MFVACLGIMGQPRLSKVYEKANLCYNTDWLFHRLKENKVFILLHVNNDHTYFHNIHAVLQFLCRILSIFLKVGF